MVLAIRRAMHKTRIQERETKFEERGKLGNVIFQQGMSSNIPGVCRQTFRGMLRNILGNVTKHSGECRQISRGMSVLLKEMRTVQDLIFLLLCLV